MIIYRVEDPHGRGPYIGYRVPGIGDAHNDDQHPSPVQDGTVASRWWLKDHHLFGFATEARLREWFEGWEVQLTEADFQIHTYRVGLDRVHLGMEQLVFDRRYAVHEEVMAL